MIYFRLVALCVISFSGLFAKIEVPREKLAECHIPVSWKNEERKSHYPLISGETFRAACKWALDEATPVFFPEKVKDRDTVFVGRTFLDFFFDQVLPLIQGRVVIVVSNGSGPIDERYRSRIDRSKVLAMFARNVLLDHPKLTPIPVGLCWFMPSENYRAMISVQKRVKLPSYYLRKRNFAYVNFVERTTPYRKGMLKKFEKKRFYTVLKKVVPFNQYIHDLKRSRFVISPKGYNYDCYRTWEAMMVGSIPVIERLGIEKVYDDLPVIIVSSFDEVTESFLVKELQKLKKKKFNLEKLKAPYWLNLIEKAAKS